jgi:hypothetical protein
MGSVSRKENRMPTKNNTTWDVRPKRKGRSSTDAVRGSAKRANKDEDDGGTRLQARGVLRSNAGTARARRSTTTKAANTLLDKQFEMKDKMKQKSPVTANKVNEKDEMVGATNEKRNAEKVNAGGGNKEVAVGGGDVSATSESDDGQEKEQTTTEIRDGTDGDSASDLLLLEMEQKVSGNHNDENPLTEIEGVEGTSGGVGSTPTVGKVYNGSVGGVFDLNHESEESDEERKDEEKEVEEEEPNMNAGNLEDESDLSRANKTRR